MNQGSMILKYRNQKYTIIEGIFMNDVDEIDNEELEAAGTILDQLKAGTFYKNQEKAMQEIWGKKAHIKFMPKQ